MRVLLLGSGAREHALAWKLSQSPSLTKLWAAPGNVGIAALCECVAVDPCAPDEVVACAKRLAIDLVVVGPEAPLMEGTADALRAAGIDTFGPGRAGARIEGSKAFAKEVMAAAGVPTARAEIFTDVAAAAARARAWGAVVVKADGLAAGKGVVVADSGADAEAAVRSLAELPAGKTILLEERLSGPEVSLIALCDGERYRLLPLAQDHKRLLDGDLGPNTGGMGAFAPCSLLEGQDLARAAAATIAPVLSELARRGAPFRGALYAGLMLTAGGPMVLEYNARLGDPETQPLMMVVDEDLLPVLRACARGRLPSVDPLRTRGAAVGVVLASRGYPQAPSTGDAIAGLNAAASADLQVFHAGTKRVGAEIVTAGGRVLTVCARAATVAAARSAAYAAAAPIAFAGRHYRKDVAAHA